MKNQEECYQALLDGKTLVNDSGQTVVLKDGYTLDKKGEKIHWYFSKSQEWKIISDWRDELPYKKRLCWVSDLNQIPCKEGLAAIITDYIKSNERSYLTHCSLSSWVYAIPRTDDEIREFLYE